MSSRNRNNKSQIPRSLPLERKPLPIRLYQDQSFTTTVNTVYTAVQSVSPFNTGEYTTLAGLFDEIIVDKVLFKISYSGLGTLVAGSFPFILAYDPVEPAVLGSLLNGMQHEQHRLMCFNTTNASGSMQQSASPTGYRDWRVMMKSGSARSQTDITVFGHDWSNMSTATAALYGYLKPYVPIIGAAANLTVSIITTMFCRVRCRT
jgi:hypothetical protein